MFYSPRRLSGIQQRALVAFAARCARRVQPLWGGLEAADRTQLERAVEIAENVGGGSYTKLDACRAEGVDVERWCPRRPDFGVSRTASGAAIYALISACCETPVEAATPALLALREAHFAAAGDFKDQAEAETAFGMAWTALPGSPLRLVATGIRRDLDKVAAITARRREHPGVSPDFFGSLWPDGPPPGWPRHRRRRQSRARREGRPRLY